MTGNRLENNEIVTKAVITFSDTDFPKKCKGCGAAFCSKIFKILSEKYRNRRRRFNLSMNLDAVIYNSELKDV